MKKVRRDMQVVFQDPYASLNPRMSVGEIVGEGPLVHGLTDKAKREALVRELLGKVGLNQSHIHRYPHEFSGGQRQRIGIARALAVNPDFVVCDEPVSALDVSIQSQVLNLLDDLQKEFGLTYLFIAHNLAVVEHISDRVGVMYLGKMVEMADVDELYREPAPPVHRGAPVGHPEPEPADQEEAARAQGRHPLAGRAAVRLPFPHPLLAARAAGQPRALRDRGAGLPRRSAPGHQVACHFAEEMNTVGGEVKAAIGLDDRRAGRGRHPVPPTSRSRRPVGDRPGLIDAPGRRRVRRARPRSAAGRQLPIAVDLDGPGRAGRVGLGERVGVLGDVRDDRAELLLERSSCRRRSPASRRSS